MFIHVGQLWHVIPWSFRHFARCFVSLAYTCTRQSDQQFRRRFSHIIPSRQSRDTHPLSETCGGYLFYIQCSRLFCPFKLKYILYMYKRFYLILSKSGHKTSLTFTLFTSGESLSLFLCFNFFRLSLYQGQRNLLQVHVQFCHTLNR